MKVKLIKTVDGYELFTQGFLKGSTNHGLIESLNIEEGPIRYKLSLKNCQEIENGYNLDELAYRCDLYEKMNFVGQMNAFKLGFQKALEILGDKKYTEKDIDKAYWAGMQFVGEDKGSFGEFIQSLQQTEWDVEIVMEPYHDGDFIGDGKTHVFEAKWKPNLDSDGCLILKRI
jgi:hypothetical protein